MARSVVLNSSVRCLRCQLPPRWCICDGRRPIDCALQVEILTHHREETRPSSTGHLIERVMPAVRRHLYRPERPLAPAEVLEPGKTLWILHPSGESLPLGESPQQIQVMLIDGSWRESGGMLRSVERWGRKVSLPMTGRSRYALRAQQGEGQFSSVEALLFLLAAFGLAEAHRELNWQFELHVYANLCARGRKAEAAAYLAESALRHAPPEVATVLSR
jgi:DTW domain-containing protein